MSLDKKPLISDPRCASGGGLWVASLAAALLLVFTAGPAAGEGQNFTWTGAENNIFNEPGNWTTNGVVALVQPGVEDMAIFNDGPWAVGFASSITNYATKIYLSSAQTVLTWDLGGQTYHLESTEAPWITASLSLIRSTLIVTNGHLSTGSGQIGTQDNPVTMIITGPNTTWTSRDGLDWRVVLGPDSLLRVENQARATLSALRIINAGTHTGMVEVAGHGTIVTNTGVLGLARRGAIAVMSFSDGGRWTQSGAFSDMYDPAHTIGTIVLNLSGGSFHVSHSGGIDLSSPTHTMLNFTLHGGATNAPLTLTENLDFGTNTVLGVSLDEDFTAEVGDVFALIEYDGTLTGEFKDLPDGSVLEMEDKRIALGGYEFMVNYDVGAGGKQVTLTTRAVPPSGTIFMFW